MRSVGQATRCDGRRGSMSTPSAGIEMTSPGAAPTTTDASSSTSATVEPVHPMDENSSQRGSVPRPIAPFVALYPTSPHSAAGIRTDPPPSLLVARGARPAASAAPAPPLDPPGERLRLHGVRVGRKPWLSVKPVWPNAGVLVLPTTIAPARLTLVTNRSSTSSGGASA